MADLYQAVRLYVNYFQPSFKLREKEKTAARVRRNYEKPMTPCERLLNHPTVSEDHKKSLENQRACLDPVDLLHRIRQQQEVLAALSRRDMSTNGPNTVSLEHFMQQLGELWRRGEVRATHRTTAEKAHYWRTRKDPLNRSGRKSSFGSTTRRTQPPRICSCAFKKNILAVFQMSNFEHFSGESGRGVM